MKDEQVKVKKGFINMFTLLRCEEKADEGWHVGVQEIMRRNTLHRQIMMMSIHTGTYVKQMFFAPFDIAWGFGYEVTPIIVRRGNFITNLRVRGAWRILSWQEPTEFRKQPIRTRYSGHVTGYQPIRDQYFLIRSVPVSWLRLEL